MIEGFRVEVTAEELVRHLDERIHHHHELAAECESKAKRLEALQQVAEEDDDAALGFCGPSYRHALAEKATRHRSRELLMTFLRNHVVVNEIYRLTEQDLRSVEWLPTEESARVY